MNRILKQRARQLYSRNFGRLNIVNQGGTPVDIKYQELAAQYPELFDPELTHPADQLLAIEEVRNQMDTTELSLDQYYGRDGEQYKEFARYEFDRALEQLGDEAAYVRRYEDDRAQSSRKDEPPEADIQTIKGKGGGKISADPRGPAAG